MNSHVSSPQRKYIMTGILNLALWSHTQPCIPLNHHKVPLTKTASSEWQTFRAVLPLPFLALDNKTTSCRELLLQHKPCHIARYVCNVQPAIRRKTRFSVGLQFFKGKGDLFYPHNIITCNFVLKPNSKTARNKTKYIIQCLQSRKPKA